MRLTLGAAIFLTLMSTSVAHAWNARGHMIVAAIAWEEMTPTARLRATSLIKLNPHYVDWTAGVPASTRDQVAFVKAATWADEIKSSRDYYDDLPAGASPEKGFGDRLKHKDWHYKNVAFSPDDTATEVAEEPNAETQIVLFRDGLDDDRIDDDIKAYGRSWLLHLVGDVHQPLHATSRFTSAFRNGDGGGNSVKVCTKTPCTFDKATALHSFWDQALGTSASASSAISKARTLAKAPSLSADVDSPATWLDESLTLAKSTAYKTPIGLGKGPYTLTDVNRSSVGAVAERRIALAGARLARLLNERLAIN